MATIYWNPTSGNDSNNGLTSGAPKLTLKAAITASGVGGTIIVTGTAHTKASNSGTNFDFALGAGAVELNGHTITSLDVNNPVTLTLAGEWDLNADSVNTGISTFARTCTFSNIILSFTGNQPLYWFQADASRTLVPTFNNCKFLTTVSLGRIFVSAYANVGSAVNVNNSKLFIATATGVASNVLLNVAQSDYIVTTAVTLDTATLTRCIVYANSNIAIPTGETYNCFYNYTNPTSGISGAVNATSIKNVNPLYVDTANGIYDLSPSSPCKNYGANSKWYTNATKWLDFNAAGGGDGTYNLPYNTVAAVLSNTASNDIIGIKNNTYTNKVFTGALVSRTFKAETYCSVIFNNSFNICFVNNSTFNGVTFEGVIVNSSLMTGAIVSGGIAGNVVINFVNCKFSYSGNYPIVWDDQTTLFANFRFCVIDINLSSYYDTPFFSKCSISNCVLLNNSALATNAVGYSSTNNGGSLDHSIIVCNHNVTSLIAYGAQMIPENNNYFYTTIGSINPTVAASSVKNVNPLLLDQANGILELSPSSPCKPSSQPWYTGLTNVIWVDTNNGSNSNNGSTKALAKKNFLNAYQACGNNYIMIVADGVHSLSSSNEQIGYTDLSNRVTIRGESSGGVMIDIVDARGYFCASTVGNHALGFGGIGYKDLAWRIRASWTNGFFYDCIGFDNCKFIYDQGVSVDYFCYPTNNAVQSEVKFFMKNTLIVGNITTALIGSQGLAMSVDISSCTFVIKDKFLVHPTQTGLLVKNSIIVDKTGLLTTANTPTNQNCAFYGWASQTLGTNSVVANPLFIDESNGIYELSPASPCKGMGII